MSQTTEPSGDNDHCSICLEAFVQNSVSTSSPSSSLSPPPDAKQKDPNTNKIHTNFCGHRVHASCLHSSIKAGIYCCPVCRQPLKSEEDSTAINSNIGGDGEQKDGGKKPKAAKAPKPPIEKDADTIALENDMSNALGMGVTIDSTDGKTGKLSVEFKSLDQLDELLHRLAHFPEAAE